MDVGSDLHLLLLRQSRGYERPGGVETSPNRRLPGVLSEERCEAAKSKVEATLKEAGDKLKSGLDDLKPAGTADPAQIIIAYDVECLPK